MPSVATLHIRGVPRATLARLRKRAEANSRSLEDELREILNDAANREAAAAEDLRSLPVDDLAPGVP